MKMANNNGKKRKHAGFLIFLFINSSFIFLLLSPYIPNYLGKFLDDRFLSGIDEKIQSVRTGTIQISIEFSNGTRLNDTLIDYDLINHDFYFGSKIFYGSHTFSYNETYNATEEVYYRYYYNKIFNYATLPFYWEFYEPEPGVFPLEDFLNSTLTWCEQNNITPKGHPLVWKKPVNYPDWLPDEDDALFEALENRVRRDISLYKDRIKIWDVVNEPIHYPTIGNHPKTYYINKSFNWANEADPDALLVLNEYGIVGHDFGNGEYYDLIKESIAAGAPIKCIGFQGREHRTDWMPATEIWATLEAYSVFGLPIHITEAESPGDSIPITNSWKKGLWNEQNQAEYVERYLKICFAHPNVEAFVYWDMWDGVAWLKKGGLVDENWQPKESYNRLDNLINNEWHTNGSKITNSSGGIEFNGFYGTYNITIPSLGINRVINAERGGSTEFQVIIS
jgi:GH35 family endo-1,4-beta-xylanase